MEVLKIQHLSKTYGSGESRVEALRDISFSVEQGEFVAVVGESGSGKSTLLNCIGALDTPTYGNIYIDGKELFTMKEEQRTIFRRHNIGFVFQSFQLVSELTVEQNIAFPILLDYRQPEAEKVDEILEVLGLKERRHHLPSQLSGGQQQRVAIGRALITRPKLILADEPTGNLDSKNSQDVMDLLIRASRHYQQTILMITHNMNLAASVDRVLRVSDGFLTDLGGKLMKSYLDLVPISAKVNKKQNRMSIFCIVLAVFLITVIFGMADMFIRSQIMQARMEDGNWHVSFREISEEEARLISARPEVEASSWYGVLNYSGEQGYSLQGKNLILCGSEESWVTKMQTDMITEGAFPKKDNEALISENAKIAMDLKIGDLVFVETPAGEFQITVCGFLKNVSKTMEEDSYGMFLTTDGFRSIYQKAEKNNSTYFNSVYFVQFSTHCNIIDTISDIKAQLGLSEKQVSENTKLLGLLGQSGNSFMLQIYGSAFILFLLVLMAGVMMIASSLNSNVAQRTEFFGMMRCIGATPKQVMRLVGKEAFGWCKFAIPVGVGGGVIMIWVLCAMLRYLSPEYFIGMPAFAISFPSIISGICVGTLTVFFAARSPAKKASRVSPLAAISRVPNELFHGKKAASTALFKIDTALGIHHAKSSKRNFVLMVGSFSLSIILFLSFSVTIDFMNHALKPLKPWTPDLSIVSPDNSCSISGNLLKDLEENPAVKRAYGRMFAYNVPIRLNGVEKTVDLISYEEHQFDWAKDYLLEGSLQRVQKEANTGLSVFEQQGTPKVGDTVTALVKNRSVDIEIVGTLSSSPFQNAPDVGTIICSENTFRQLTGYTDYTIIDLQLSKQATQKDVDVIHASVGSEFIFSDERLGNRSVLGSYYSFGLFIYGFMTLIALITIFNIVNSIAMSVLARMKEYGAFRAIGLSNQQMKKMIVAEASTYAIFGGFWGCALGLISNKLLYEKMITFYWGEQWKMPFVELGIIIGIVIISVMFAVNGPMRRIRKISIVETMSAR